MRMNLPRKVDLRHLVEMVLQPMNSQRLRNMPPILPIPHLKIGKIPFSGQKKAERPLQILDLPIRQLLSLESELRHLALI
jgi:hypothetical protein